MRPFWVYVLHTLPAVVVRLRRCSASPSISYLADFLVSMLPGSGKGSVQNYYAIKWIVSKPYVSSDN